MIIHLGLRDVALSALLVLVNVALSLALRLGVHRQVLWASLRMVVQLCIVGLLLKAVFHAASPAATVAIGLVMAAAAAREVAVRPAQRFKRGGNYRISALVVGLSATATVLLALLTAIRPEPWYDPRYAISLLGIILGSVLNAGSLAMDSFLESVTLQRGAIEARLALGATMREALAAHVRAAVRRGMIPVINQMSAAGLITLPGIMTGQLLAGVDPMEAVKYQILLLFMLTGAGGIAAFGVVALAARSLTDARQRLRLDRLR
ncbi:iron export ABC transporter permease subunit FetB [Xylophilus rhododendri]|uniref:Iron export ABC transporter permease subunit FetB n=1 Tax=Xylophilus rhododendri TaxID=2697032 RepID=A0A857JAV6_9BURK|nr:iron export ABC transporter permease subunit FetB [Xylophilus rhododendri]QHJ00344.1 iron export ABC transporter permease subunit FetB [Xylophilus rhododendri]